jgi:hypothetical protein
MAAACAASYSQIVTVCCVFTRPFTLNAGTMRAIQWKAACIQQIVSTCNAVASLCGVQRVMHSCCELYTSKWLPATQAAVKLKPNARKVFYKDLGPNTLLLGHHVPYMCDTVLLTRSTMAASPAVQVSAPPGKLLGPQVCPIQPQLQLTEQLNITAQCAYPKDP